MNIILLSRYFPPEIGTAANLFFELSYGLGKRKHTVTVVTGFPWYNLKEIPKKYNYKFFMREKYSFFNVVRFKIPVPGPKKVKLAIGHLTAPLASFFGALFIKKTDIIFAYSPPIFFGLTGWLLSRIKGIPFILGVQDLHPKCYIDQGVLKNKVAIKILEGIESFCYKKADIITVHSEGNKKYIVEIKKIPPEKVVIIPNWLDTDELHPLARYNEFSKTHKLDDKFIVGYAGTLGMSQGLLSIIEAARILKDRADIEFFIVGDGIEKKDMISKTKEYDLSNVRFLEMQTKKVYPAVLAASDVSLVTLNKKVKTPVVPSKILSIMAAGRPVLASMPLEGDAPRLIAEAKCGICVGPEDPVVLANTIVFMYNNKEKLQEYSTNGRKYVVANYSLEKAAEYVEEVFEKLISGRRKNGAKL